MEAVELVTRGLAAANATADGQLRLPEPALRLLATLDQRLAEFQASPGHGAQEHAIPWRGVSADLPTLPGVPARIGPIRCPCCDERQATLSHEPDPAEPGDYGVRLICFGCGSIFELETTAYIAGLAAGMLVALARMRPLTSLLESASRSGDAQ